MFFHNRISIRRPATAPLPEKSENWGWRGERTVGPLPAGAYRYNCNVDGLTVVDPRNPAVSESNNNAWSLVTAADACLYTARL